MCTIKLSRPYSPTKDCHRQQHEKAQAGKSYSFSRQRLLVVLLLLGIASHLSLRNRGLKCSAAPAAFDLDTCPRNVPLRNLAILNTRPSNRIRGNLLEEYLLVLYGGNAALDRFDDEHLARLDSSLGSQTSFIPLRLARNEMTVIDACCTECSISFARA